MTKLLDILVENLTNDAWPKQAISASQDRDGSVYFSKNKRQTFNGMCWLHADWINMSPIEMPRSVDYDIAIVTREDYIQALIAYKTSLWNGTGLPPIGVEFEYGTHRTKALCLGVGEEMVFACKGDLDDENEGYEEFMISILDSSFHPVRTEGERKRENAVSEMINLYFNFPPAEQPNAEDYQAMEHIYDAIAAGKIPGVVLRGDE